MKTIAEDPELTVTFGNEQPSLSGNKAKLPQIVSSADAQGHGDRARTFRQFRAAPRQSLATRFTPATGPRARMPAPSLRRSSRPASRPSAPMPCPAWRRILPPCWMTATAARTSSTATPTARTRRWKKPSASSCANGSPAHRRPQLPSPMSISGARGSRKRPARNLDHLGDAHPRSGGLCACSRATSSPPSIWPMNWATTPTSRTRTTNEDETEPDAGERQETPEGEEQESQQPARRRAAGRRRRNRSRRNGRPADGHRRAAR